MTSASPKPHACVVLAVDPAKVSGWAIVARAPGTASELACGCNTARTADARRRAAESAFAAAFIAGLPLVVCAERWSSHGAFGGARTQRGLGAAWGRWAEALEIAGVPKRRIVRVYAQTWAGAILSAGGRGWTRERREAASIAYVKRRFGIECGADEAAAVCLGVYGMHCAEVAAALPKARKGTR